MNAKIGCWIKQIIVVAAMASSMLLDDVLGMMFCNYFEILV